MSFGVRIQESERSPALDFGDYKKDSNEGLYGDREKEISNSSQVELQYKDIEKSIQNIE